MPEFLNEYWLIILVVVLVGAILGFLLFRPRQSVRLSDSTPTRPHMAQRNTAPTGEGKSVADEMAAATSDVAGDIIDARVHDNLPGASGPPDNLQRLKGVGPRLEHLLNEHGIIRFEQIARLTPAEIERLDQSLGPFRGRIQRDRIVDQADYLARGDVEGFEARFGRL